MFEMSLVESTSLLQRRSRWPVALAIFAQACALVIVLAIPLLHPETLSLGELRVATVLPPPPVHRTPPTPPQRPVEVRAAAGSTSVRAPEMHAAVLPLSRGRTTDEWPLPETGIAMTPATGSNDNPLASIGAPAGRSVGVGTSGPATGTLRISKGVSAGLLLEPIRPVYPRIAQASRVEGTVVVEAIITKSGQIASAHVVSGSPMLQGAAIDAVRCARYRPYLLNGEPTEVETTISIVFRLGS